VSGLSDEAAAGEEQVSSEIESPAEGEDVPDWVEGTGAETIVINGGPPDWLSEVADEEVFAQPTFAGESEDLEEAQDAAAGGVEEEFPGLPGEPGEVETPSWLASLQDDPADPEAPEGSSVFSETPSSASITEGEASFILEPTDLPDWLDEVAPTDFIEEESVIEETPIIEEEGVPEDVPIAPAELPNWLQAMRPVEEVTPSEIQEEITPSIEESVGPLAGLEDVLRAEPGIVHFGLPSPPITGLDVTQTQKGYATILQSMIAS
jgi:hypothetical protein